MNTPHKRHSSHRRFLDFWNLVEREVPTELGIHLAVNHYETHTHLQFRAWIAAKCVSQRPQDRG